jgi:hypothetical protein
MEEFMPNTTLFEATDFFPGLPAGGPVVTENFARALFQLAERSVDVRSAAAGFALKSFEHYRKSAGRVPYFPAAWFSLYSLKHDESLPLLIAVSVDESPRMIFGLLTDIRP